MIRIGCSFGFGRSHIAPAITELMRNYPELQVHFELFDRQIDLVQDNIDLDIRINDEIPDYYIAHLLTKINEYYVQHLSICKISAATILTGIKSS